MKIYIYDPKPYLNEYVSKLWFPQMVQYALKNGHLVTMADSLEQCRDAACLNATLLTPESIAILKNNGCKVVGFSCTDSSYVDQSCRAGGILQTVDMLFMLTGIQKVNSGREMIVKPDFTIGLEERQFLPEEDWKVFHEMHQAGRLQSLPYVHWERQVHVDAKPYALRSQKALIRGGHHMRRFLLALKLMEIDRLDINSGFVTTPYFQDEMNPQFRYCDKCRAIWKTHKCYPEFAVNDMMGCTNEMHRGTCNMEVERRKDYLDVSDLGRWNNKCPESFYAFAREFGTDSALCGRLLNAQWLNQKAHLEMLARITFTSDLKWLFSIYAAQRFWDAAMVGCVNLLPRRTGDQDYFPVMNPGEHYWTYSEDFSDLGDTLHAFEERHYVNVSREAKALYDNFLRPTDYAIGTPILKHIFSSIEQFAS